MLEELFPLVEEGTNYICITRPRRFGKTVMANMITAFFSKVHDAADSTARFIFVLDEWDFLFHQSFVTEKEKMAYLAFLRSLLKDRPYVLLAYMTGILPIAKYSSGSELNMFTEFSMAKSQTFSE